MSRVFNMRTYLLSLLKSFFGLPGLLTPCSGPALYSFSYQAVFVVITQAITHHHSLVIVDMG